MPRRLISLFLTLSILLSGVPACASLFVTSEVAGGLRVDGVARGKARIIIPQAIDGKLVIEIGAKAFVSCPRLKTLTVPPSVARIDDTAFLGKSRITVRGYAGSYAENFVANYAGRAKLKFKALPQGGGGGFSSESVDMIFDASATAPIGRLAKLSIVMADTVYDKKEGEKSFKMLGFGDIRAYNYPDPSMDHGAAFMLAKRRIKSSGREYTLFAAIIRGTMDSGKEWLSNAELGPGDNHLGIATAGDEVYEKLLTMIGDCDPREVKIWVAGFSRGAAVTNYVCKRLWDKGYNAGNLYGYAFACPTLTLKPDPSVSVFNYDIDDDFVPKLPPVKWGYGRNGKTFLLKSGTAVYDKMKANYKKLTKQNYSALTGAQSDQLVNFVSSSVSAERFKSVVSYLRKKAPAETANAIESLWKGKSGSFIKALGKLIWKLTAGVPETERGVSEIVRWIADLVALIKLLYGSGGKVMNAHDGIVYNSWMQALYGE